MPIEILAHNMDVMYDVQTDVKNNVKTS